MQGFQFVLDVALIRGDARGEAADLSAVIQPAAAKKKKNTRAVNPTASTRGSPRRSRLRICGVSRKLNRIASASGTRISLAK